MISEFTWPNHDLPSDKEAVKRLLQGCRFDHDVAYGKTKVFVRTPRTLFSLEEQRAEMLQRIVVFLQKVSATRFPHENGIESPQAFKTNRESRPVVRFFSKISEGKLDGGKTKCSQR